MAGHSVPIMFVPITASCCEPEAAEIRDIVVIGNRFNRFPAHAQATDVSTHRAKTRAIAILGPQPRVVVRQNKDTLNQSHRTLAWRGS